MLKNQLGPEANNLTEQELRQLADSYYEEFDEDDAEIVHADP